MEQEAAQQAVIVAEAVGPHWLEIISWLGNIGIAGIAGTAWAIAALAVSPSFQPTNAPSVVFPGMAVVWFAFSVFLLMLGLVGEVAIRQHRLQGMKILPFVRDSAG